VRGVCLLLVAGCYHGDDPPGVPHPELSIDVVVRFGDVRVYANPVGSAADENLYLPQLDECLTHDDVISVTETGCLIEVSVDGVAADLSLSGVIFIGTFVEESSVLTLRGCGSEARIPLHAEAFPNTQVELVSAGDVHTVSWTRDPAAGSTLVYGGNGFGGGVCHVPADVLEHSFTFERTPHTTFYVQPLLPVEVTPTAIGDVRVWRGNTFVPSVQ
jgi:hypothetical protein